MPKVKVTRAIGIDESYKQCQSINETTTCWIRQFRLFCLLILIPRHIPVLLYFYTCVTSLFNRCLLPYLPYLSHHESPRSLKLHTILGLMNLDLLFIGHWTLEEWITSIWSRTFWRWTQSLKARLSYQLQL